MKFPVITTFLILVLSGCAAGDLTKPADAALTRSIGASRATPIGGLAGGALVLNSGVELTRREQVAAANAEYRALETMAAGQPVVWRDEKTGRSGTVTAAQPYRVGSQDCRPYSHVVNAGGPARSVRGTACRNADGSWTLLN